MPGIPKSEANRHARQMIRKFGLRPTEAAECAVQWAAEAGYMVSARQILSCRRPPGLGAVVRPAMPLCARRSATMAV